MSRRDLYRDFEPPPEEHSVDLEIQVRLDDDAEYQELRAQKRVVDDVLADPGADARLTPTAAVRALSAALAALARGLSSGPRPLLMTPLPGRVDKCAIIVMPLTNRNLM
jgi:hypothetical protein